MRVGAGIKRNGRQSITCFTSDMKSRQDMTTEEGLFGGRKRTIKGECVEKEWREI